MSMMLLSLLVGCGATPASIKFDGDATQTVHTMDAAAVEKASVLDKDGNALDPQPEIAWTVTPDSVAKLDGTNVTPVANGESTVKACVGDVCGEYKFVVALPDKVAITGLNAGETVAAGTTKQLTAAVMAGDATIDGQAVTWASDNAAVATVDDKGMVTAVAPGTANVTATSGALNASMAVTVGDAAPATADAAPAK